ncbi:MULTISPECIES: hypothetical protein [unclassified Yoonia]|uniref:hypothetical protein n=1 Tax=unclassified Yoonia TaxID=2629118 RepID=UPI002AFEBB73|nr:MULTISPECIES: hypothetical protein [unclassified Yoonia]
MLGFLIAAVAGYFTPQIESAVGAKLTKALAPHITLAPGETRLLAFMVAVIGAGIAAELLDSDNPFWVALGASLGYFGPRIIAAIRARA